MLALLSYPTLVEPRMALHRQAVAWSWGFAVFAAVCVLAAWRSKDGVDPAREEAGDAARPTLADQFLWIGLGGLRFDFVAGCDQPSDAERCADSVAVGSAVKFVPAQLHFVF